MSETRTDVPANATATTEKKSVMQSWNVTTKSRNRKIIKLG